ncbi:TPA: phage tail protein [Streptococcus suis]|nr:phage tail protein [Streptococcus suis]
MIYLFDKDEKLIKIIRKSAVKTALQKYALTTERYVSDRLTVELKGLNADELEQVEYMAIQTMEDAHTFHYFYVAQKFSDELTTLIGVQSGIEELRKSPVYDKRPKNAFARDVITDLLAGTNWQARFVGETTPHSTNFYYTSIFDALKKVCEVWDLEMQFFVEMNGNRIGGRYIDFKRRIGEAVGKRVVYGHNALQILQEVERTNIFTALVGRGKGEETGDGYGRKITFEDAVWSRTQGKPVDKPKGQKYLELPLMTRQYGIKNADGSMRPKIGFVDFSEEENPEVLIERTYRALVDSARPQLTLKTSSVYLKGVKVGDTIRVVRHDKKLDYDTRIFEITFNRLNNQSSDIKLGDRIGESNEAKAQTIADKAVEQFVTNEFSNFVQNLPDYLPSADGFNNNWYGAEDPTVKYPGKVLINDIWYKPDPEHEGHKIMFRWTGEVWEEILRTYESESLRDRIAEEIAQVNTSMQAQAQEHDRQVADILSKTQSVESLANQAKSDAASALARANQVKTEAIADARAQVATVSQALNTAKSELQSAIASADQKARDSQASATALRNDLNLQASKILEQARAQTALTSRVTTVETLADGTKTTVAELSKTVSKATGDIASVTARTKTVEDTLGQTRTQYEALTQTVNAQTGQIESINRKTADLQSGIDGVTERFESLQVGGENLLTGTRYFEGAWQASGAWQDAGDFSGLAAKKRNQAWHGITQAFGVVAGETYTFSVYVKSDLAEDKAYFYLTHNNFLPKATATIQSREVAISNEWKRVALTFTVTESGKIAPRIERNNANAYLYVAGYKLERGSIATDYSSAEEDLRSEIATYVRNAAENSAELSRQIQLVDGKAVEAKTYAQQTADVIKTRLESLETYKDGESTRASQYLSASRTETARQVSALRTAVTEGYVAKARYEEDARGVTQRFEEAQVGSVNLVAQSKIKEASNLYGFGHKTVHLVAGKKYWFGARARKQDGASDKLVRIYLYSNDWRSSTFLNFAGEEFEENYIQFTPTVTGVFNIRSYWSPNGGDRSGRAEVDWYMVTEGTFKPSTWSPAPEDQQAYTETKLAEYKNTVDGQFVNLQTQVNDKAAKGDVNGLAGRLTTAETSIQTQAGLIEQRLTATQVEQAISAKGFATTAVVENKVRETAESFSRTISEVETKIPTEVGTTNLIRNGQFKYGENNWSRNGINQGSYDLVHSQQNMLQSGLHFYGGGATTSYFGIRQLVSVILHAGTKITVSVSATKDTNASNLKIGVHFRKSGNIVNQSWKDIPQASMTRRAYKRFHVTFELPTDVDEMNFMFLGENSKECNLYITDVKVAISSIGSDWSPAPEDLVTVTALHTVNDKVDSHTRIIGAVGETGSILDNVSKVTQTAAGLVQEVSGTNGLKTQVGQLKNSWAVKISGPEGLKTAINASTDGVRLKGKNLWLDGNTLIDNAVITSAMIAGLDAGKITTGYLDAARIRVGAIDGSKIAFDEAFFNGLTANQAYLKKLFAKDAFLTAVQAVTLSASQIIGGLMRATTGAMEIDFNNSAIDMFKDGAIRFHSGSNAIYRQSADGTHTAFVHFDTTSKGGIYASLGSTSSRDGINSKSSGRFAGIRVARTSERSDSHVASQDAVELYGDTIFFGHGFEGGGFSMHTTLTGGQTISLNKMHDALINLCRCWIHLRNEGFNLNSQAFRKSLDIEIHNAQQLYNTIERIT